MTASVKHPILVLGGAGNVGAGIAKGLLEAGRAVIVTSRSAERLAALSADLEEHRDHLTLLGGDVGDEQGAVRLREKVTERGPLGAVVASLGGWWQGLPLLEVPLEIWERVLHNSLGSHFLAAKTFLPPLAETRGSYVMINGPTSEAPAEGASPVAVAAAGQRMLFQALVKENPEVRLNEIIFNNNTRQPGGPEAAVALGRYLAALFTSDVHSKTVWFRGESNVRVLDKTPPELRDLMAEGAR